MRRSGPTAGRRGRTAIVVLGAVLAFISIFAIWAERQSLRTERWTATSEELIERPEIQAAVARYAVDQLYENVDVRKELRSALPEDLRGAAGPAAAGLRGLAESAAQEVISSDRFQRLWRNANRLAHEQLVDIVTEEEGAVLTGEDEAVILDLRPLVIEVASGLGVGEGIARDIPRRAGEIEILRADELETAQTAADAVDGIALATSLLAVGLFALALALSPGERWLTAAYIGAGLVVAGIVALLVREVMGDVVVEALAEPEVESAAAEVWSVGTSLQSSIATVAILYGAGFLLAAWLGSPTDSARGARRALAPVLKERPGLVIGLLAIPAAIWTLEGLGSDRAILTRIGLATLALAGVVLLRRMTLREFPSADLEDVTGGVQELVERAGDAARTGAERARSTVAGAAEAMSLDRDGAGDADRERKRDRGGRRAVGERELERLERLAALKKEGALTKREFEAEKAALLGGGGRRSESSSRSSGRSTGSRKSGAKASPRGGAKGPRKGGANRPRKGGAKGSRKSSGAKGSRKGRSARGSRKSGTKS